MHSLHNRSSISKFLYLPISIIRGCALDDEFNFASSCRYVFTITKNTAIMTNLDEYGQNYTRSMNVKGYYKIYLINTISYSL